MEATKHPVRLSWSHLCSAVTLLALSSAVSIAGPPPTSDQQTAQGSSRNVGAAQAPSGAQSPIAQVATAIDRVYISSAQVLRVTPAVLKPGEPFMVTLGMRLATPIRRSVLISTLKLYINAIEVKVRQDTLRSPGLVPERTAAGVNGGRIASQSSQLDSTSVTLFASAPDLPPAAQTVVLSVYSILDGREIAVADVSTAASARREDPQVTLPPSDRLPLQWLLGASAAAIVGLVSWQMRRARRKIQYLESTVRAERGRLDNLREESMAVPTEIPPESVGAPPKLPPGVLAAMEARELVLVLGPAASAQSGLPTKRSLWLNVLDRLAERIPDAQLSELRSATGQEAESAIDAIIALVGRDSVVSALRDELTGDLVRPSKFHELLARLPVAVVLDLNWDDLAPRAFSGRASKTFAPSRQDGLAEALRSGQLALIKPFGDVRQPESVLLTGHEYRSALARAPELERSIAALFSTRTFLFFGFDLRELEQFVRSLPAQIESSGRSHFAIVPSGPGMELWLTGLGRRYGLNLIEFKPSADWRELVTAAAELANAASAGDTRRGGSSSKARIAPSVSQLAQVRLRSIGLFRDLQLDFEPGWTLLLGTNGGGKSTVLRAVALALAGNDPRATPAARKLLRTGESEGLVELQVGTSRIISSLVRDGQEVLVNSPQTTALQAGQVLILGFPALRGVNATHVRGPTNTPAADPSVDDLAPLLESSVDGRLDNLQQWVVNTVLRAEKDPRGRHGRMLRTFELLISEMVPGGGLTFARVDRLSWQIILRAGDAEVPLSAVSQGMSSILNWIGVLLQRMYDVFPQSPAPEHESAIVLIDEIDAHLHPQWQRQLVALTRSHFPNVQVIASSHSPLLAGAVKREELRVLARHDQTGEIQVSIPQEDLHGHKAEDILVSSLFSLSSTRNLDAENEIRRYVSLLEKISRSPEEEEEFTALSSRAQELNYGTMRASRLAMDKMRLQIEAALSSLSPDAVRALNNSSWTDESQRKDGDHAAPEAGV